MGEFFFRVCTLGGAAGHEERKRLKKLKSANTRVQKTMSLEGETGAME